MSEVRLILGDCLSILPTLAAGSVDAVVTDSPYGIGYPYLSYDDTRENLTRLVACFVPECRRIAERVAVFPGVQNIALYPPSDWVCCFSWDTTGSYGYMGFNQWQPILIYGKDRDGFGNTEGVLKSDRLHFNGGKAVGFYRESDEEAHPCAKPINVMVAAIRRFTEPGDTVLDPFMGSGTTGVACVQTGRNFIGIEIDEAYFKIAERRIAEASNTLWTPAKPRQPDPELYPSQSP